MSDRWPIYHSQNFDKIGLSPKTVAGLYEVSRRMLQQAPQIEDILRNDLSFILRQALDSAAIQGGGANEPTGILTTPGIQVLTRDNAANGSALLADDSANMIAMLDAVDASGATGFLSNTLYDDRGIAHVL